MRTWDTVAIVGVGLIGGSIGLALRRRGLARQVVGIGRRESSLQSAARVGAVDATTLDLARGVADAELAIVCTPVGRIAADVRLAAEHCPEGALITDAGSTKAEIVAELERPLPRGVRFVGSHPLAGSEKNGPEAASAELFVGRTVILTPTAATRPEDLQAVEAFWTSLGARAVCLSPDEHDRVLAAVSHLPHLAASALAAATPAEDAAFAASGWLDTTRVASGDAELWQQILLSNRDHVLAALVRYENTLAALRDALQRRDAAALSELLAEAKRRRDNLRG